MLIEEYAKHVTKLFEDYIDTIQEVSYDIGYEEFNEKTDVVIVKLQKLKSKIL